MNSHEKVFFNRPRPKVLVEVKRGIDPFAKISPRVNLSRTRIVTLPLRRAILGLMVFLGMAYLFFGSVSAPVNNSASWQITHAAQEDRAVLESQLAEYEKQILEQETLIKNYKKQGDSLSSEIKRLNARVAQLNLQLAAVNLSLRKLDGEIALTTDKIGQVDQDINSNKGALSDILKSIYEKQDVTLAEMLLANPRLSDFFGHVNNLILVQNGVRTMIQKISDLKNELVDQKEHLGLERADAASLKAYQDEQKAQLADTRKQKTEILTITKGQEQKYRELAAETKKKAADIRNRIFRLLGGGELPFGEAVKIAQVAEKAIGVRAAFILATLVQESSVDGRSTGGNVGQCYYNTPKNNPSGTVMSNAQQALFLALVGQLNLNPATTPVSCPNRDGVYGGAMGPGQFMPTTWDLYKNRIAQITGGNPASPFNNLDAFVGTGLYLNDGMTGCRQIYSTLFSQENCAAAKYYAGGKWRYYTAVGRYGYRVASRAEQFQQDIEVLDD